MNILRPFFFFCVFLGTLSFIPDSENRGPVTNPREIRLNEAEKEIFRLVNEYREQNHLPAVKFSPSLSYVAYCHVRDLAENLPADERCNLHSWSEKGPWSSCCYTEDHMRASCMWAKPRELTSYKSDGYEIAYWTNEVLFPDEFAAKAIRGWKKSPPHNEVMVNLDQWKTISWKAMGVGVYKGYAVVWFGDAPDEVMLASE
ncbi:MAG: CAP domain-containing protein [Syntrophothermus sp.]